MIYPRLHLAPKVSRVFEAIFKAAGEGSSRAAETRSRTAETTSRTAETTSHP
jgi:hypothetical protein